MQSAGREALLWGLGEPQFFHPRRVGMGRDHLFLWVSLFFFLLGIWWWCLFNWVEGQSSKRLPLVWIWMQALPHPGTSDLRVSHASTSQASLPCSEGPLGQLLTYMISQSPLGFPLYLWSLTGTCAYSIPLRLIICSASFLNAIILHLIFNTNLWGSLFS